MKLAALVALGCVFAVIATPQRKKKKDEDFTQTREIPKDPPAAAAAETSRLVFHVSPLSAKGLLSQQSRDALRAVMRSAGNATIVKIRAFVAGSGDLRRVRDIVSDTFTERKLPLPALTTVQAGGLPMEGAQVVLESIAVARKDVNPNGLIFISGQGAGSPGPLDPVAPLLQKSLADLRKAAGAAHLQTADILRVTCFLSSLDKFQELQAKAVGEFPQAAWNFIQVQRAPVRAVAECEAVGRARSRAPEPLAFRNPEGMTQSPNFSQIALVSAPRLVLTGTQTAFGFEESDARLAFQRLQKELEAAGSSVKDVAFSSIYPLSASIANLVRKVRFDFYDKARPPASTMLEFEGLPSMDSSFAVDVVAIKR